MKLLIRQKKKDPKIKEKQLKTCLNILLDELDLEKEHLELSLYLVDNTIIKNLNRKYRGKNKATDVLSFEQEFPLIGDVVISVPFVKKQAREMKNDFLKEFYLVFIHGILHLLGFDHEKSKRAEKKMFAIQNKILNKFVEAEL